MKKELAEVKDALTYTASELAESKTKFDQLAEAKNSDDVRRIRLGDKPRDVFTDALTTARTSLDALPLVMHEAIYQSLRGTAVAYPNRYNDPDGADDFDDAIERRLLIEEDDHLYVPNTAKAKVAAAIDAVAHLTDVISHDKAGPEFGEWFESEYSGLEPDLRDRDCWEALLT